MTPKPRIPALAAVLSLFLPGLGQLYCGKVARALAIASIGSIAIIILGLAIRNGNVLSTIIAETILGSALSIAITVDAWFVAKKAPQDYIPDERNRIAAYVWYFVLITLSATSIAFILADQLRKQMHPYRIAGASMHPNLIEGDTVFAHHEPYLKDDPKTGDLIVYQSPKNRKQQWLSRVIAQPGQTVEIRNHELIIDGEVVPYETVGDQRTEKMGNYSYQVIGMEKATDMKPVKVPPYHVFLMSDNRSKALDSRKLGPVGITSIDGRLSYRYFPRSRSGKISQPE